MALLFMDSFDHYGTGGGGATAVMKKWDTAVLTPLINITSPRTGPACLGLGTGSDLMKLMSTPGTTFILGMAVRTQGNYPSYLIQLQEGATIHIAITLDPSGFLVVKRGATTLATATTNAFSHNSWYYLEVKVVIDSTVGSVVCHVDGVTVTFNATLTGINTRNGGTGIVDRFQLSGNSANNVLFDDLYLCDASGTRNNDFLGICAIESLLPQTATPGDLQDFTCSTGTDHGALVDELPPNDDTDYNSSSTVGQQDTYNYPSLALPGSILGVQTNIYVKKTDAGARTVAALVRMASTTYPGAAVAPLTTYKYFPEVRETNPNTGLAWTSADITALQAGMKIVS